LRGRQLKATTDLDGTRRRQARSVLTETEAHAMSIGKKLAHKADPDHH
jgi:hypothetical protein